MIKILIADDHRLFRRGLKQTIEDYPDLQITGEAGTGDEVLALAAREDFDLIILDITMPGANGLDILKQLKDAHSTLPVLILSMHPEDQYAIRALKAGAAGYLSKEIDEKTLIKAIKKAVGGGRYVSPALAEKLAFSIQGDYEEYPHEKLSDREYEVMLLIAAGHTISVIAERLHLGVTTVSTYRARILEKMGFKSNAEIISYAIQNKLID